MADQAEFDRFVARHFRWNFTANVIDVAFYMFGLSFVSWATVLPLLVSRLTTSKLAIGMVPAIYSLGFLLPQLLTANYTERLPLKKRFIVIVSGPGERGPYLLIGLIVWAFAIPHPTLTLILIYVLLTLALACAGASNPAWTDLIAKVIPVSRRGRWAGVAFSVGAILGLGGAVLAGALLGRFPYSMNFGLCFFAAGAAFMVSWGGLAMNREPAGLVVKPHMSLRAYLRLLPAVLRRDLNYVRFLISRSVAALGGMAGGFFMVYGAERFGFGGAQVGLLTAILTGSQAVTNPLWGMLADRVGHKAVLCGGAFSMVLASAAALVAGAPAGMYVAFALMGLSYAAESVSGQTIVMEFASPHDRPTYVGLTNTLLAPCRTLGPIIGGILATWLGYRGMFPFAVLLAAAGGVLMMLWVREPRGLREDALATA